MDITTKSRAELRSYFVRNAIPTESNFRDFIEGVINPKDDGLSKSAGRPLAIEAANTADQPAIHLYERFTAAQTPNWSFSLLPGINSGGKLISRGLSLSSGAPSGSRLFIEEATGNVGIGTVEPGSYLLNVAGSMNAAGLITASGGISVPAGQALTAGGPLNANGGVTVPAGQALTAGGPLNANGGINVPAGQALTAGGPLNANGGITVPAGQALTTNGALNANGGINVPAGQALTTGGPLNANGGITIPAGKSLTVGGTFSATAGAAISGGTLNANGGINVPAGQNLAVGGLLSANGGINVPAGQNLAVGGLLSANGGINVPAGQNLAVGGLLSANGGINVPAGQNLAVGGLLSANGGINVPAGQNLAVGGLLSANGGINVPAGQNLAVGGLLSANGGINVPAGQNLAVGGLLSANGGINIPAGQTLAVGGPLNVNGTLTATQPVNLNSGAALTGDLTINGTVTLFDNTIYLRSKADRAHGMGYCGPNRPFQGRQIDGAVLFGYAGGGLGTTAPYYPSVEGVLNLDGTNSYVQLPPLNIDFSQGLTIEAVVYYNSFNTWSRILDIGNGAGSDNILLANAGQTSNLALTSMIGGSDKQVTAVNAIPLNTWTHLCATMDATGKVTLYVNGSVVGTGQSQLPRNLLRNNCYIGRSNWSVDGYLNAKIANVRIWQRALTAQEVANVISPAQPFLTNGALSSWVTGLAGFWPLSEASGATARDVSGRGNHGTLQGKAGFEGTQKFALMWDYQSNVTIPTQGILTGRLRPAIQSFTVYGDFARFYPVVFNDDGWTDGPLELTLSRYYHQDSSARGSTIFVVRTHSSSWGNGSSFLKIVDHYYAVNQFIGGVVNSVRSPYLIVWLRGGGTTYQWRTNHPARLIDCSALDSRSMSFSTNAADSETYTSKIAPDANLSAIASG